MKRSIKIIAGIITLISVCCFSASCGGNKNNDSVEESTSYVEPESESDSNQTIEVKMKLNLSYAVLEVGETVRLTVLGYSGGTIQWTSSNPSVCEVSDGVITAKAEGGAEITATSQDGSAACRVVVQKQGIVAVIELENPEVKIFLGNSLNVGAKVTFKGKTVESDLTYVSENTSVATVDSNGRITGVGLGETFVSIRDDARGLTETVKVTVINN